MKMISRIIATLILVVSGYRIQYRDCTKPNKIIPYNRETVCMHESKEANAIETFNLLQQRKQPKMKGYSCSEQKSTFVLYCGAFSHTKIAQPPTIEINVKVGLRECDSMISTLKFKTMEGGRHPVKLN